MAFRNYIHTTLICEEIVEAVETEELETFLEDVYVMEAELNEFLKLGKLADKLKSLDKKADEKAEKAKEAIKDTVETAKYAAKNMAKEAKDKVVGDAKAVAQAHKEIAIAAKNKAVELSTKAQDAFKEVWGKAMKETLSPEQKAVVEELKDIFAKMSSGKYLSKEDSIKVLAATLADGGAGKIPTMKAYNKELERVRTSPGFKSIIVSVKINKNK